MVVMKRVFGFSYFFRWGLVLGVGNTWNSTRPFSFSLSIHTALIPAINSTVLP